jgi:RNA-directed DNA polymerase
MKRFGNLWTQVTDLQNLFLAARAAQKGKRFLRNVLAFNYNLESEICLLQNQLTKKIYRPGEYRTFRIVDPKPRLISAAPYRDRVVHHALCQVIMPILESTLIADTFANRRGFGSHRALNRFTSFARSSDFVLQCDVRKYFPSIDHAILKTLLRKKIKCKDTLWLIDTIIDASNEQDPVLDYFPGDDLLTPMQRSKGLPIGNLTSQFFANLYLSPLDHYIKEQLKIQKYLRYVDDFALFSDDHQQLTEARLLIEEFLFGLRLTIHPIKSQLFETRHGANFVGFRIFPDRIRVRNDNLRRARIRLKHLRSDFADGKITLKQLIQRLRSWEAHLLHANTRSLRYKIFSTNVFTRKSE